MASKRSSAGAECREQGDDESISDDEVLWRRIPPGQVDRDGQRPHRGNFRDPDGELSVSIASETNLDSFLKGHDGFRVVAFTAGQVRALGEAGEYVVRRAPTDEDASHAVICPKLTGSHALELAQLCEWV